MPIAIEKVDLILLHLTQSYSVIIPAVIESSILASTCGAGTGTANAKLERKIKTTNNNNLVIMKNKI